MTLPAAKNAVAKMDAAVAAYRADPDIPEGMAYSPKSHSASAETCRAQAACIAYVRSLPDAGAVAWRDLVAALEESSVQYGQLLERCDRAGLHFANADLEKARAALIFHLEPLK